MTIKNDCCSGVTALPIGVYRRVLWIVLVINFAMFCVEMSAGVWGSSVALQADALDFLGDSANYVITLVVIGMRWRAGAAMVKGLAMTGFGSPGRQFFIYSGARCRILPSWAPSGCWPWPPM